MSERKTGAKRDGDRLMQKETHTHNENRGDTERRRDTHKERRKDTEPEGNEMDSQYCRMALRGLNLATACKPLSRIKVQV